MSADCSVEDGPNLSSTSLLTSAEHHKLGRLLHTLPAVTVLKHKQEQKLHACKVAVTMSPVIPGARHDEGYMEQTSVCSFELLPMASYKTSACYALCVTDVTAVTTNSAISAKPLRHCDVHAPPKCQPDDVTAFHLAAPTDKEGCCKPGRVKKNVYRRSWPSVPDSSSCSRLEGGCLGLDPRQHISMRALHTALVLLPCLGVLLLHCSQQIAQLRSGFEHHQQLHNKASLVFLIASLWLLGACFTGITRLEKTDKRGRDGVAKLLRDC